MEPEPTSANLRITCSGCDRLLEIASNLRGRDVRCPVCDHLTRVPEEPGGDGAAESLSAGDVPAAEPPDQPQDEGVPPEEELPVWHVRTPEGRGYGPVTRTDLVRWIAEGRISDDCELRETEEDEWQRAGTHFPVLVGGVPFQGPAQLLYDTQRSTKKLVAAHRPRHVAPHRGGMILTLALVGWLTCPLLSAVAVWQATVDLREMDAGRMDERGRDLTQAGQVLGLVAAALFVLAAIIATVYLLATSVATV